MSVIEKIEQALHDHYIKHVEEPTIILMNEFTWLELTMETRNLFSIHPKIGVVKKYRGIKIYVTNDIEPYEIKIGL